MSYEIFIGCNGNEPSGKKVIFVKFIEYAVFFVKLKEEVEVDVYYKVGLGRGRTKPTMGASTMLFCLETDLAKSNLKCYEIFCYFYRNYFLLKYKSHASPYFNQLNMSLGLQVLFIKSWDKRMQPYQPTTIEHRMGRYICE